MKSIRTLLVGATSLVLLAASLFAAGTTTSAGPAMVSAQPRRVPAAFTFQHSPSHALASGGGAFDRTSVGVLLITGLAAIAAVRVAERRHRRGQDR